MNAAIIVGEHYDLDGMPVVVEAADQHEVVYRALNDQDAIDRGWGPTSYGTYEGMTTPASFARDAVMTATAPRGGQSQFESPLVPVELADAPDIENVPVAESTHALMEAVVEMHHDVRQIRSVLLDGHVVIDPKAVDVEVVARAICGGPGVLSIHRAAAQRALAALGIEVAS